MTERLAMLPFHRPEDPVAFSGGQPISAAQLAADAQALAQRLPESGQMLNGCTDRYWFLVGLAAAMLRGHLSVLPHNQMPDTLALLRQEFAGLYALSGPAAPVPGLPAVEIDKAHGAPSDGAPESLAFPPDQMCACLFTSGSTGQPEAYQRNWAVVLASARAAAKRFGFAPDRPWTALATVPPQHSYGFESSVFLPLVSGGAVCAERPFYPADIASITALLPQPRLLVTTPVHLRALLGAGVQLAPIDLVISATALLPLELAHEVEKQFNAPLQEIYGATESGQTASRRPVQQSEWTPLDGVTMTQVDGRAYASGAFVGSNVLLSDYLDILDDGSFRLLGRTADLVNVAGKRGSIAQLNARLTAIPGVTDGVFVLTDAGDDRSRLAAFYVSDSLDRAQVLEQLKQSIEAAFLPRPLIRVPAIPRDGTGKATRQRLLDLLAAHTTTLRGDQS